jgi:hypothetical protein
MSGAGETRNSRVAVAKKEEAERMLPSAQAAVRQYWRNGINWTVYRTDIQERRGLKAMPSRIGAKFRRLHKNLLQWMLQPWP